jgi:E3 SUMO-protein ligase PIAS1
MIDDPSSIEQRASPYQAMASSSSSAVNTPATPASYLGTPNSQAAAYNMGGGPAGSYRILGHPSKLLFALARISY